MIRNEARVWNGLWMALALVAGGTTMGCDTGAEGEREVAERGTSEQTLTFSGHDYLFVTTPTAWGAAKQARPHQEQHGGVELGLRQLDAHELGFLPAGQSRHPGMRG